MKRSGFTLVELSIVLVIIGLIVGGVLVGRDLIRAAEIRAQTKQMQDLEVAIATFKLKYNCLAGDCTTAISIFGTTSADGDTIVNGDGDGILHGNSGSGAPFPVTECLNPAPSDEVTQLTIQLAAARLGTMDRSMGFQMSVLNKAAAIYVSCLGSTVHPTFTPAGLATGNIIVIGGAPGGGRIGYSIGSYGTLIYGAYGSNGSTVFNIGIPMDAIWQMDVKTDDGVDSSGKFQILAAQAGCNYTSMGNNCLGTPGKRTAY